ncbi:GNAT family N-acetyltransferase [Fulvivirga sp.]|uniref:GNAT family N-acetyltransferase n=1 Tax=Fulvivirga sp. TaxID=1931237 RepID=UPI0032EC1545
MNHDNISIQHDQQNNMFYIRLNGSAAHLKYEKPKENVVNIKETYVPAAARKIGLASQLVKHTIQLAKSQNKQVVASCSFAKSYMKKHAA